MLYHGAGASVRGTIPPPPMSSLHAPEPTEIVYESPRTGLGWKAVVALATGAAFDGMIAFARWGLHPHATYHPAVRQAGHALGALVTMVVLGMALASRVVRRVSYDPRARTLRLDRDPGATDVLPFHTLDRLASVAPVGGWSRDPSERLVVTLRDGTVRGYTLPDDADTPAIVAELETALGAARGVSAPAKP